MNKVLLNPANYQDQYIEYMNFCFPNWGQKEQYDWVFNRTAGSLKADILLLTNEEDQVIAGSGITYRNIKTLKGEQRSIGVFTGSWTLPQARGRGCFTQIIQEFLQLCAEKNIDYLTAFVTESNASYRRFQSLGSETLVADNILSDPAVVFDTIDKPVTLIPADIPLFYDHFCDFNKHHAGYAYSLEAFAGQYVHRNTNVYNLKIDENQFLIEENSTTVRVLYFLSFDISHFKLLSNWASKTKAKKIMFFLTNQEQIAQCHEQSFVIVKSYFTINKTSKRTTNVEDDFRSFRITLADKM